MFPPYMYNEEILDENKMEELVRLLDMDNKEEKVSHIYNKNTKENVINKHLRSSKKIEYVDEKLFGFVDKNIVDKLNVDNEINFYLVKNDLEIVKYKEGDYFKKHQDYVNFTSDEFQNYTFLVCINKCKKGGETILYLDNDDLDKDTIVDMSRNVGSILLFKKEIVHEGKEVMEGEKTILKGNLIGFKKENKEDLMIISFLNSENKFVIPISSLNENTIYRKFYDFNYDKNTHVYMYEEKHVSLKNFTKFYFELIDNKNNNDLDYIGIDKKLSDSIISFNNLLNNKKDNYIVSMVDYYNFLNCKLPNDILPFQYISIESNGKEFIVWLGIYNNIFITCDMCIKTNEDEEDSTDEKIIENEENNSDKNIEKQKKYCEKIIENRLELDFDQFHFNFEEEGSLLFSTFFEDDEDCSRVYVKEDYIKELIYEKCSFKNLEKIFKDTQNESSYDKMIELIIGVINQISYEESENADCGKCFTLKPETSFIDILENNYDKKIKMKS